MVSGLQREVLALYRLVLRAVRAKPAESRAEFRRFAREQLDAKRGVDRKDFLRIEDLLRRGRRQLELFGRPDVMHITTRGPDRPASGGPSH